MTAFPERIKEAQITQVVHDVRVIANEEVSQAAPSDKVGEGAEVRTGDDSRAELTFTDQTIARLGSHVIFSFKDGTRHLDLANGAMFLEVPRKAKGARIHAAGVAANITGATVMFESHPAVYKFLVLQGTARLYRPRRLGDSVLVRAGQMVIGKPNAAVSDPVDFDIVRFVKTCRFITDFLPLRSAALMAQEGQKQQQAKSKKRLIDTNLVIFGEGTRVSLVDPSPPITGEQTNVQPAPVSPNTQTDALTVTTISTLSKTQGLRPSGLSDANRGK